ncbi:MAG TPA: MFS transporter [Isosphaeraceae bacterium]|nr:MFS transporter [Isosphaeraceae bacterium]
MADLIKESRPDARRVVRILSSLPRNVWVVTLTSFLTDVSSEMPVWILPLYLSNVLGAPMAAIGLIEGAAETTASLLKVFSGWISDRLGQRKWLAVAGYAISTLAKPALLAVLTWRGVLAVRIADRIGKGIRTAPRDALVADSIDASQRGLAFGIHRAGDTAGAVLGVLIALFVVANGQASSSSLSAPVFRILVVASVVPAVLAVLGLALLARDTPETGNRGPGQRLGLRLIDGRFRFFLLAMVVFTLGNSSDAFLILRAQNVGLSLPGILGMVLSYNLVYALFSGPAGALSDRVGRRRLLVAGWLLYALIYLGFARVTAGWQAWALMTVYGLYTAACDGVAKAFVADLVPASDRGTAYGVFHTAVGLAAMPASLLAGILWQGIGGWPGWGPSAPFILGAVIAVLASIILMLTGKRRQTLHQV